MITAILAFFQALPSILGGVTAFINKYYDAKVQMYTARLQGDVEAAKAMLAAEIAGNNAKIGWMQAVASSPILSAVVIGFAFPFVFYINKVIVYDYCLGLGSTPTIKYELLATWGGTIINGIFISSGAVAAVNTWVNRKG